MTFIKINKSKNFDFYDFYNKNKNYIINKWYSITCKINKFNN